MSAPHHPGPPPGERAYFLDKPENVRRLLYAFYALCAALVVVELFIHRHVIHSWENLIAFYPLYGFVSIVILVLLARILRRIVMRSEDYYDVD